MKRVLLADVPTQPWRNGGGLTRPLLTWPTLEDAALRVSVATIEHDGPFSSFAGQQRWFAVLEGAGVSLALPQGEVALDAAGDSLCFDGAAAPHCRLRAGPTQDLNLMVCQDRGFGRMVRATPGSQASHTAAWSGLYAADALMLEIDGAPTPVAAGTLLWREGPQAAAWRVQGGDARAWWLDWWPR